MSFLTRDKAANLGVSHRDYSNSSFWKKFFIKFGGLGFAVYFSFGLMYGEHLIEKKAVLGTGIIDSLYGAALAFLIYLYQFYTAHPHIYSFVIPIAYTVMGLTLILLFDNVKNKKKFDLFEATLQNSGLIGYMPTFERASELEIFTEKYLGLETEELHILCINGCQIFENKDIYNLIRKNKKTSKLLVYEHRKGASFVAERASLHNCTEDEYCNKKAYINSVLQSDDEEKVVSARIRTYSSMPVYRLIFNSSVCLFQGYHTGNKDNAPVFVCYKKNDNTEGLYEVFRGYFLSLWDANSGTEEKLNSRQSASL